MNYSRHQALPFYDMNELLCEV